MNEFESELTLLGEFLSESGARLSPSLVPRPKFTEDEKKELLLIFEFMDAAIKGTTKGKTLEFKSQVVSDFMASLARPALHKTILSQMSAIYLVTLFEAFVKNAYRNVLTFRPELLRTGRQFTAAEVLSFPQISDFTSHLIDKEVDELGHGSVDDVAKLFDSKMKIEFEKFPEWEEVRELSFRRNLIIHNQGITNRKYCSLTKHPASGQKLETDPEYVKTRTEIVARFATFLNQRVKEKFVRKEDAVGKIKPLLGFNPPTRPGHLLQIKTAARSKR